MRPIQRHFFALFLLILLSIGTGNALQLLAQAETNCDLDALLEHQQEHAASVADLEHAIHDDLDAALENLYITGVAYQMLAVDCGFNRIAESVAAHVVEHETDAAHAAEDDHDHVAILEAVRVIGDPENGAVLFNTLKPEVGFACATCHRVDTTERLIGPGLLGIGSPEHDPSEHETEAVGTPQEAGHAGHDGGAEAGDEMSMEHAMDMGTPESDDHTMDMAEADTVDPVEYIRVSILDPSAFLVPDFPDHLMPKTYGEIFTEDEINDLIAYLMTLQ